MWWQRRKPAAGFLLLVALAVPWCGAVAGGDAGDNDVAAALEAAMLHMREAAVPLRPPQLAPRPLKSPRVWDDALPVDLLRRASEEASFVFAPGPHLKTGRTMSLWVPVDGAALGAHSASGDFEGGFALEAAVRGLHHLVFGSKAAGRRIIGAEVWAQLRDAGAGMPPHYGRHSHNPPRTQRPTVDLVSKNLSVRTVLVCRVITCTPVAADRDEAGFEQDSAMRHPRLSTVTYLTDGGGPTVVLNHSAAAQQAQRVPSEGWAVWPRAGRHLGQPAVRSPQPSHGHPFGLLHICLWYAAL